MFETTSTNHAEIMARAHQLRAEALRDLLASMVAFLGRKPKSKVAHA